MYIIHIILEDLGFCRGLFRCHRHLGLQTWILSRIVGLSFSRDFERLVRLLGDVPTIGMTLLHLYRRLGKKCP